MRKDPYDIKMSIDGEDIPAGYVPAVCRAIVAMERATVNYYRLMGRIDERN